MLQVISHAAVGKYHSSTMTNTRSFLLLFLEAILLHNFLVLAFLTSQQVNGFFLQHPSGMSMSSAPFGGSATKLVIKNEALLASSVALDGRFPETNSSFNMNNRELCDDEIESTTTKCYPWSDMQQWALRDSLPKYTIRIPIKEKSSLTSATSKEDTVLSTFALWKSLQNDVPELAGYPIDFLQTRYEEIHRAEQSKIDAGGDDDGGTIQRVEPSPAPGVLPFLQDYAFSSGGGISGYVYGMDGVSDGSRIETSSVKDIKESLPRGFIQTSDGHASFELGNPLQTDDGAIEKTSPVKDLSLEGISNIATTDQIRSLINNVDDGDGMLLRLGALSGVLLAGATAFNMLSHHMTVNVFWV